MRSQLAVNAALVAFALGTLAVVWATRDAPTTAGLEARKHKLLAIWDKDAVSRIRLRRGPAELELFRDAAGDFRIVRPWPERADVATVSALLGSLDLASALRPADGVARNLAGLTKPSLEIHVEMAGKVQVIALGGPAPAPEGARYAEVTGEGQAQHVYTISQGLVAELDLPWDKFREPRLLEYGRSDLAKIGIDSPSGRTQIMQRSPGAFFWQAPGAAELANPETIEKILTVLARLATEQFVEPEAARSVLGVEAVRVRLELKETHQSPVSLTLGGQCPSAVEQVVALREQVGQAARAGCVPRELVEALRVTPDMLALARPFAARPDEVEELRITRGDAKLELARKGSGFLLRAPSRGEVALDAGNQRLGELLGAQGQLQRPPQLGALGLEQGTGEVLIQIAAAGQGPSRSERVVLGKPRGDGTLCLKRDADGVVLCIEPEAARAFEPDATLLKSLELLSFAPSDLLALGVDTASLHERIRRTPDGSFELTQPRGFRHDGALVSDVVQALGTLRAERWVAARDDGSHGLAAPRLRVSLELTDAQTPNRRELLIGAETRAGFFASLSPDPSVFVLARSSVASFEAPLLDRALCPFAASELSRIELREGTRLLLLTRRADAWEAPGMPPARAGELGEALSALRAERTVHLGAAKASEGFAKPSLVITFVGSHGQAERVLIGALERLAGTDMAYARRESVDATFALSATTLTSLQGF